MDAEIERIRNRINASIAADGHMPEETVRGATGIWYTYFALAPMTAGCQIAWNARGVDLFNYGRLKLALDYLFYYSQYPDEWPHYSGRPNPLPQANDWPGNLFDWLQGVPACDRLLPGGKIGFPIYKWEACSAGWPIHADAG